MKCCIELASTAWRTARQRELARVRHVGKKRAQKILVAMESRGFYVEHLKRV